MPFAAARDQQLTTPWRSGFVERSLRPVCRNFRTGSPSIADSHAARPSLVAAVPRAIHCGGSTAGESCSATTSSFTPASSSRSTSSRTLQCPACQPLPLRAACNWLNVWNSAKLRRKEASDASKRSDDGLLRRSALAWPWEASAEGREGRTDDPGCWPGLGGGTSARPRRERDQPEGRFFSL